ncbi:DUF7547 family protein [Halobaculum sp. EA56]|uniref:DUF7547 family protein n=1 Tax=Halobaculum sp. EA56 TaxID=3421648 RepID=UPI003EBF433B
MTSPSRGGDRDVEDLRTLVSELEATLSELRAELDEPRERRSPRDGGDGWNDPESRDRTVRRDRSRGRNRPRPPRVGELFRFTSDYTIPTVVAVLEATIEALELLQGVMDLAAPGETPERRTRRRGRGGRGAGRSMLSDALADGVTSATDRAATDAADALARLRDTLSEADLPEDGESRDLVADARELSAELERRVRESRDAVDRERERERRADRGGDGGDDGGPVTIAVGEPGHSADEGPSDGNDGDEEAERSEDGGDGDAPEVDVDAELESIKRQVNADADGEEERGGVGDGTDGGDVEDAEERDGGGNGTDGDGPSP